MIIIRSNLGTVSSVLVRDLGFLVPSAGGTETFTDQRDIEAIAHSQDIRTLTSDGAYVGPPDANDNTLIINDGVNDIDPGDLDSFFGIGVMVGATPSADGAQGLVPQPVIGDQVKFLRGDGTWATVTPGTSLVVREIDGTPTISTVSEIRFNNGTVTNLGGGAVEVDFTSLTDYAGRFESASISTGDITLNKWGWWYDTVNTRLMLVRNRSNTLYGAETTTL